MAKSQTTENTDVEVVKPQTLTMSKRQDAVAAVTNLAELTAVLGKESVTWDEIEPSFDVRPKEDFEAVPVVIAAFRMNESKKFLERDEVNPDVLNPRRFVSLLLAAYDENSGDLVSPWVIVNDGSTGIYRQLLKSVLAIEPDADLSRDRFNAVAATMPAIVSKRGFRRSDYPYEDEKGNVTEATTWYIG